MNQIQATVSAFSGYAQTPVTLRDAFNFLHKSNTRNEQQEVLPRKHPNLPFSPGSSLTSPTISCSTCRGKTCRGDFLQKGKAPCGSHIWSQARHDGDRRDGPHDLCYEPWGQAEAGPGQGLGWGRFSRVPSHCELPASTKIRPTSSIPAALTPAQNAFQKPLCQPKVLNKLKKPPEVGARAGHPRQTALCTSSAERRN